MTTPNMATITESLERSLQNCFLNHDRRSTNNIGGGNDDRDGGGGEERSTRMSSSYTSDDNNNNNNDNLQIIDSDTSLELNSHLSLPYHLEQCLDLKTVEIYYTNCKNGMKAIEDPRSTSENNGDFYSDEDDDDDDDDNDDDSLYDSEESQLVTSHCSTRERKGVGDRNNNNNENNNYRVEKDRQCVGCKSCFMYFMVPKQVADSPKCNGRILHFDRSETSSPSSLLH